MADGKTAQQWDSSVDNYIAYATKLVNSAMAEFATLLEITITNEPAQIVDAGAGTGALTSVLSSKYPRANILATDISHAMLSRVEDRKLPNVQTQTLDWSRSPTENDGGIREASIDLVASSFMVQFLERPTDSHAVKEMARIVKPGGHVAVGIWGPEIAVSDIFARACKKYDPDYKDARICGPDAWYTAEGLKTAFQTAGLSNIQTKTSRVIVDWLTAKQARDLVANMNNPGIATMRNAYKGNQVQAVLDEFERIVREEYRDGKDYFIDATFAVGEKI